MLGLLTIISEEMKDLSTSQKRIFMSKLQERHVPDYLVQFIHEAGEAARAYRSHNPERRTVNKKEPVSDGEPK
jgi:hypothetical protein